MTARENSPAASGDATRAQTLVAPADCPKTRTRDGSPPNVRAFLFTQESAAI
jgi:hypothetical protein